MNPSKEKWHQSIAFMTTALVILGPLAIPLVWINRKLSLKVQILITVGMLLLSALLFWTTGKLTTATEEKFKEIQEIRQSF